MVNNFILSIIRGCVADAVSSWNIKHGTTLKDIKNNISKYDLYNLIRFIKDDYNVDHSKVRVKYSTFIIYTGADAEDKYKKLNKEWDDWVKLGKILNYITCAVRAKNSLRAEWWALGATILTNNVSDKVVNDFTLSLQKAKETK